jgi:hypothetical protein
MTLSIADFRKFAKVDSDDCIARDDIHGGFKLESQAVWDRKHRTNWHASASNEARRNFIECLKREYPQIAALIDKEIAPYLSENGRPLKSWHVREVLDRVDRMLEADKATIRDPRVLVAEAEFCLDSDGMKYFEDQMQPAEKVTSSGEPPVNLNVAHEHFDRDYEEQQRDIEQGLIVGAPGAGKREPASEEPELVIFRPPAATSGVPQAAPQAAPPVAKPPTAVQNVPPRQPRGMNPASFDRSRAQAKLKRTDSKGKGPEVPRAEPKRTDAGNPQAVKVIKDTAWKDLSPLFKGIKKHVASAQDEAAKPLLGKSKKKAQIEAAETEDKFRLIGGEIAFADLFAKPPKLDGLATVLAKCNVETKNPLSVYFDLPKIMGDTPKKVDGHEQAGRHWLFRMINAKTKLDAEQVIREIDAFIEQLGKDIEKIETKIETLPLSKNERDRLSEVIDRLHSIHQNICDKSSPLLDLKRRCVEVQKVLPEDLPSIGQGHHYLATVALTEQMGIFDLPTGTSDRVKLANRMLAAHNMVRRQLSEGNPWEDICNDADPQMKPILEEYRRLRLAGIAKQVKSETGVTMNLVDGKDGEKIYYFMSENRTDERQAEYLLRKIAFSMGGSYRDLLQVFGYVKWDLEDVLKEQEERAKEQAATA